MDIMEIVLLAAGGVVFILSFLIPMKKEESSEETRGLAKEEIKALVSEELEAVRGHVDDVVEEAVTYSIEKTERSLERLSNEKIMAVNEYSDTVLAEIHKNHEEVMFLYDMLNDKHTNLKNTVSEVNRTVKEVIETKKEAEEVVNTFQRLAPETVIPLKAPVPTMASQAFVTVPQETVPPVFAAAPVSVAVQSSEGQKVSPVFQNTAPMPQKVSMVAQQVSLPPRQTQSVAQQVSAPSRQTQPVAQQVSSSRQTQPVAQQVSSPPRQTQPEPRQVAAESHQASAVSLQPALMPQKVSSASRQAAPTPQKVTFPASKRGGAEPVTVQAPAMPQVSVTAQMPVMPQAAVAPQPFVPQQSLSEPVSESGLPQSSGMISFTRETDDKGRSYNDRVLELYKSGKSNVAIARELNLGVGEVKLVIDLYKNRSEK